MLIVDAIRQAEMEYARLDRAQDHLAPDSVGYVELGPIVPWIVKRAAALAGASIEAVHAAWFASCTEEPERL